MDVLEYLDKFGNIDFEKRSFNDIDNLVFCSLSYLDFTYTSINKSEHTLDFIGKEYLKITDFKYVKKLGMAQRFGYKLLRKAIKLKRYKDLIVHNYVYSYDRDKQFSAMMFRINPKLEYISFEGTDELVSGWKEDFELSYKFPIPAQKDAIKYVNKYIKIKGPNVIIGGHSKGGNLALVASMYTNILKQHKIKKIYNNDGPGLRTKEFESIEYKRIKNKIIHFVPEYSIFGILLRHGTLSVIKSTKKGVFAHAVATWLVDENGLISSKLSERSNLLQENILMWLRNHSDKEKEKAVTEFFKIFEDSNVEKVFELSNIQNLRKVLSNAMNVDEHSKKLFIDLIKYNLFNIKEDNKM